MPFHLSSDERLLRSRATSAYTSRLSTTSRRYFDFLDSAHSVFSKESYYSDKQSIHPWLRRPCSRNSGIALSTLGLSICSRRTEELAQPRIKRERLIRQGKSKQKQIRFFSSNVFLF